MEENKEKLEEQVITNSYTKDIEIPSNGYLGGPAKITIRAMTAAEEKILYSSRDFGFIKKICKSCTVNPKMLDTNKLLPQDLMFILFQIRELTFGPVYKQPIKCPHCGMSQEADINIADFEYTMLDKDIDSKLFVELPISKAKVHLKFLSQDEIDFIEKESAKMFNEGKISDLEGYLLLKKVSEMIDSVSDLEFKNDMDKISYVNKLHAADFNAIRNKLSSVQFGLINNTTVICQNKNCEEKVEVTGTICPEFFRPTL